MLRFSSARCAIATSFRSTWSCSSRIIACSNLCLFPACCLSDAVVIVDDGGGDAVFADDDDDDGGVGGVGAIVAIVEEEAEDCATFSLLETPLSLLEFDFLLSLLLLEGLGFISCLEASDKTEFQNSFQSLLSINR